MTSKKKILVGLMRMFFGIFGVDMFIRKEIKQGIIAIIITIVLWILPFLILLLFLEKDLGDVTVLVCEAIVIILRFVRAFWYFISGLLMICKINN